ncbi:MAG: AmmeMemoRadiSam system protein B [Myxococcota bacterium]
MRKLQERVRPPAVAGMFYPANASELSTMLDTMLAAARAPAHDGKPAAAFIMPHAGYIYSGPIAATGYRAVGAERERFQRVVVLGPSHRVMLRGMAIPTAEAYATPLGTIPVDAAAATLAQRLPTVTVDDLPHCTEHSMEVQLPFLQRVLGDLPMLMVAVGSARPDDVADLLEQLRTLPGTLIIISSDLSHYLPYDVARDTDLGTTSTILSLDPGVDHEQACGATPVNGLLTLARRKQLEPALLDYRNSGDTAGDRSRVVGYASLVFREGTA